MMHNRHKWKSKAENPPKTPPPQHHHATATLQATLKRHVVTRCEDPRHTSRTNTPGEAPVLCYQYCHKHPRGVKCWGTRAEYFDRIMAKHGRKKMGRAWA